MERVAPLLSQGARSTHVGLVVLGASLAVVLVGGIPGLILKFLVGRIAYSTSDAAALLTLAFGILVLLPVEARNEALWRRALGCSLAFGYVLHLALLILVARRHGLAAYDFVLFWEGASNSFNSLTHSHVGKAGLAVLAGIVGLNDGYDTGTVFLGEMPRVIAQLLAATFVATLVCAIAWSKCVLRAFQGHAALQWLAALAVLGATKSQLDGGCLSGEAFAALAVLAIFLRHPSAPAVETFLRRRGSVYALSFVVAYPAGAALCLAAMPPLPPFLGAAALYVLLAVLALHGWHRPLAWALAAYIALLTWVEFEAEVQPLVQPLPSGAVVWTVDDAGELAGRFEADHFGGMPLLEVYRQLGDRPLKPSFVLVATPGAQGAGRLDVSLGSVQLPARGMLSPPEAGWRFAAVVQRERGRLDVSLRLDREGLAPMQASGTGSVVSRNNFNVYLHWLARRLRDAGWQRWTMGLRATGHTDAH